MFICWFWSISLLLDPDPQHKKEGYGRHQNKILIDTSFSHAYVIVLNSAPPRPNPSTPPLPLYSTPPAKRLILSSVDWRAWQCWGWRWWPPACDPSSPSSPHSGALARLTSTPHSSPHVCSSFASSRLRQNYVKKVSKLQNIWHRLSSDGPFFQSEKNGMRKWFQFRGIPGCIPVIV